MCQENFLRWVGVSYVLRTPGRCRYPHPRKLLILSLSKQTTKEQQNEIRECIDTKKPTTGRVLLKSRRPHHKQNPLHMQGVSQKP